MKKYTKDEYIATFGQDAWENKVVPIIDGDTVDFVYATDNGNIFMIMNKEEV